MSKARSDSSVRYAVIQVSRAIAKTLEIVIGIWFFGCLICTGVSTFDKSKIDYIEGGKAYEKDCIERGGNIRLDSRLLMLDVYCRDKNGNETIFIHQPNITFDRVVVTFIDRVTLSIFEVEELFDLKPL